MSNKRFKWESLSSSLKQLFFVMKLTTLLCFVGFISVSASIPSKDVAAKYGDVEQSQTKKITGTVQAANGDLIPGATVIVAGTTIGTVTNIDGAFTLEVPVESKTLVFSFIGYTSLSIAIGGNTSFGIILEESTVGLDEVVVVGYGTQKKESVLGAINQVKGAELLESGSTNLTNALSGISPGLNIVQTTGQPGADDGRIFIRGNENPLILVDGVEVVGGFSNIDPRDVESVSTLKDGAATSVYGIRGANGVIIITTKRGKMGKPKVSFTTEFSVKDYSEEPDVLDAFTAQSALNVGILNDEAYLSGYSSDVDLAHWRDGDLPYLYPNTNWSDLVTKNFATSSNHTVSVQGGNNFVKYYASGGFLQDGDIFKTVKYHNYDPEYNFKRYSFRGNLDFTLSKTTKLKTSISSRLEDKKSVGVGFIGLYTTPPANVAYYPAEVMEQYPDPLYPGLAEDRFSTIGNVYRGLNDSGMNYSNKTIFSVDFELTQDLKFITKGLKFMGKYNYISSYTSSSAKKFDTALQARGDTYNLLRDGTWFSAEGRDYEDPLEFIQTNEGINNSQEIAYLRAQLNYNRSFGMHNVTGLALFSRNKKITNTQFPYYNEDWVGRVTYNYDTKYFLELSGAYNGDETFARGYRFKFFPSFAVGVNLARENFIKDNIPALNNFKVRYSYGETGNKSGLKIPNSNPAEYNRWQYLSFYDYTNSGNSRYWFGEDLNDPLTVISETQLGNLLLTWATVTKQNIGVDFGLFESKITGSLEFFKDHRDGLIARPSATVPIYFGSSVQLPYTNMGASESHGYEVSLTYKNRTSGGFNYSVNGFYAFNENRILVSAADGAGTPEYAKLAGKPAGASALLQADGYFQNIDEIVNYPEFSGKPGLGDYRYIDYNANGTVVANALQDQIRFNLPASPMHSYSLRLGCSYKGWYMSALINGTEGHKGLINSNLAYALPNASASGRNEQMDYWTPTNTDAKYPALHTLNNPNLSSGHTARIVDLDYIKLRSMNLGYNFDMSKSESISALKIYLNGSNLLTFSNLNYGDPEGNSPGSYPILRRINLGLNVSF